MSPSPVHLVTERLVLTMPARKDAELIVDYVQRNREHLEPWEPIHPPEFYSTGFWRERLEANRREFVHDQSMRLVVFRRGKRKAIGFAYFNTIVRGAFHACFLGYSLDAGEQGRGLMTEALGAAVDFAFDHLHLHRVMANHLPENHRSAAVLARLGFMNEGFARDYLMIAGKWRDHVLTARINPRWAPPAF